MIFTEHSTWLILAIKIVSSSFEDSFRFIGLFDNITICHQNILKSNQIEFVKINCINIKVILFI